MRRRTTSGTVLDAPDALFALVEKPDAPQQIGAVLMLGPRPDGTTLDRRLSGILLAAVPGSTTKRLVAGTARRRPGLPW